MPRTLPPPNGQTCANTSDQPCALSLTMSHSLHRVCEARGRSGKNTLAHARAVSSDHGGAVGSRASGRRPSTSRRHGRIRIAEPARAARAASSRRTNGLGELRSRGRATDAPALRAEHDLPGRCARRAVSAPHQPTAGSNAGHDRFRDDLAQRAPTRLGRTRTRRRARRPVRRPRRRSRRARTPLSAFCCAGSMVGSSSVSLPRTFSLQSTNGPLKTGISP